MKSILHRRARPMRQAGQAVIWFLVTVAACCSVFALVYNVGQMANKKEETTNAADAAALSGALVEARVLNFEAYTNRAMVANEVTIAQLLSLDSWVQYNYELAQWLSNYTSWIPGVNGVTSSIANVANQASSIVHDFAEQAVPATEYVNSVLVIARDGAHFAGAKAANEAAEGIAKANATTIDGRFDVAPDLVFSPYAVQANLRSWNDFTDPYTGNGRDAARDVVNNSRDAFSAHRGEGDFFGGVNDVLYFIGVPGIDYFEFKKTSGTTMLESNDHWSAQDSLDLYHHVPIVGGYRHAPLGYGRVDAGSGDGTNLCNDHEFSFIEFKVVPTVNCRLAETVRKKINWSGLPNFRDLAKGLAKDTPCSTNNGSDSPSLTYLAATERQRKATISTEDMGWYNVDVSGPQGSPRLKSDLQNNDQLTSISSACVFFFRPDATDTGAGDLRRGDTKHEYASLYNPYWQARLTAPSSDWATALYTQIGAFGLNRATQSP